MTDKELTCRTTVRIFADKKAFGPGVADVLRGVRERRSLQGAAQRMGMSYSKAWTVVREAERIWGFPLTACRVGGKEGGGSVLTAQGEAVLNRYDELKEAVETAAREAFDRLFSPEELDKIRRRGDDNEAD